jgi:hypothetical protein
MTKFSDVAIDPLQLYEHESSGKEFQAFVPNAVDRRANETRRDELIVKTWRGKPTDRGEKASIMIRDGLSSVRDFETQRVIDSERMFVIVLGFMTVMLGAIFTYFVMNFHF